MIINRSLSQPIAEVRRLVTKYEGEDIKLCMKQALQSKPNPCLSKDDPVEAMNVLAKAGFVSELVQQGHSIPRAMRELGRRIRLMQESTIR